MKNDKGLDIPGICKRMEKLIHDKYFETTEKAREFIECLLLICDYIEPFESNTKEQRDLEKVCMKYFKGVVDNPLLKAPLMPWACGLFYWKIS